MMSNLDSGIDRKWLSYRYYLAGGLGGEVARRPCAPPRSEEHTWRIALHERDIVDMSTRDIADPYSVNPMSCRQIEKFHVLHP